MAKATKTKTDTPNTDGILMTGAASILRRGDGDPITGASVSQTLGQTTSISHATNVLGGNQSQSATGKTVATVARGCGDTRTSGSIYFEFHRSPSGRPLGDYIIDPVLQFDPTTGAALNSPVLPSGLNIPPVGTVMFQDKNGTYHIADRIGKTSYPNVADYLEEVDRYGVSRKLNPFMSYKDANGKSYNNGFDLLTPKSRIYLLHDNAWLMQPEEYWDANNQFLQATGIDPHPVCPKGHAAHAADRSGPNYHMCAGLWWQDVDGGTPDPDYPLVGVATGTNSPIYQYPNGKVGPQQYQRNVTAKMPAFTYKAMCRPPKVDPVYLPAFIASFPLQRLAVVKGGKASSNMQRLANVQVPVVQVDF